MGISDLELVDAIRKGEIIAFQELYKRYADLMYRNILVRVNSSFDADDIFQDFFIKLWEKRANFKIESNVKVYLLVALKHHILNTIKERQIRLKYQEASGQALIEEDDYTWVKIVSEDLSERHLSVKEIAEKLAVSEQTVKNQLTELLKRLRKEMNNKNFIFWFSIFS